MAFHLTAVWDFKSQEVMVISCAEDKAFWLETQELYASCTTTPAGVIGRNPALEDDECIDNIFSIYFPNDRSQDLRG